MRQTTACSFFTEVGHAEGLHAKGSTALGPSLLCACQGTKMVPVSPRKVIQCGLATCYLSPLRTCALAQLDGEMEEASLAGELLEGFPSQVQISVLARRVWCE